MQHNNNPETDHDYQVGNTAYWTMLFSTVGGVYRANVIPTVMLDSLTVNGSVAVAAYAFVSALVGYATKRGLDYLINKIKKR